LRGKRASRCSWSFGESTDPSAAGLTSRLFVSTSRLPLWRGVSSASEWSTRAART
jgi:hypothetical protein